MLDTQSQTSIELGSSYEEESVALLFEAWVAQSEKKIPFRPVSWKFHGFYVYHILIVYFQFMGS